MSIQNVLSKEQFKELYTFLSIIKPYFEDFAIVQGQFRSRDDSLACIVETYFDCFNERDFAITNIKRLVKMLGTLSKTSDIAVTIDEETVSFADEYQTIRVDRLSENFSGNTFRTVSQLNDIFTDKIDANRPLIKETLPKSAVANINKVSREFGTDVVTIRHEADNRDRGYILIKNTNDSGIRVQEYTIKLKENLLTTMDENHFFSFYNLPYNFNKSDMILEVNFFAEDEILGIIHKTKIDNLSITTYGRAAYLELDRE